MPFPGFLTPMHEARAPHCACRDTRHRRFVRCPVAAAAAAEAIAGRQRRHFRGRPLGGRETRQQPQLVRPNGGHLRRTSARTPDEIQLRADTAWVTLWAREDRSGRAGQTVPVARREGQWVAMRTGTTYFVKVDYEP